MPVEITVTRLTDGSYEGARNFGPWTHPVSVGPGTTSEFNINGTDMQWDYVNVSFRGFEQVGENWWGGALTLSDHNYCPLGLARPFLFFGEPCDIPMHTVFSTPYVGTWVVALRSPRYQ
jgi:hypothetical protein